MAAAKKSSSSNVKVFKSNPKKVERVFTKNLKLVNTKEAKTTKKPTKAKVDKITVEEGREVTLEVILTW